MRAQQSSLKYIVNGTKVQVSEIPDGGIKDKLPSALYTVEQDQFGNMYLTTDSSLPTLPNKVYGKTTANAELIFDRFIMMDGKGLGVLLTGLKGTGKTILITKLILLALYRDYPVIQVKNGYSPSSLANFLSKLQDCVVIFDEFEKMYETEQQDLFLNFFDDKHNKNRLVVLAANNSGNLTRYIIDRPSRFYYNFKYSSLDNETIVDMCKDNNLPESLISSILLYAQYSDMTFDILQAIVSEYKYSPKEKLGELIANLNLPATRPQVTYIRNIVSCSESFEELIGPTDLTFGHTYKIKHSITTNTDSNNPALIFSLHEVNEDGTLSEKHFDTSYITLRPHLTKVDYQTGLTTAVIKDDLDIYFNFQDSDGNDVAFSVDYDPITLVWSEEVVLTNKWD